MWNKVQHEQLQEQLLESLLCHQGQLACVSLKNFPQHDGQEDAKHGAFILHSISKEGTAESRQPTEDKNVTAKVTGSSPSVEPWTAHV